MPCNVVFTNDNYYFMYYEVPDVACSEAICLNGGSCSKVGRSHVCDCLSAFSGLLCEIGMLKLSCHSNRLTPALT